MERVVDLQHGQDIATFAGGCFWGMEDLIRNIPGVIDTEVGYTGGVTKDPNYESVKVGNTSHAESIQVIFDPKILSFEKLLEWFFKMHDPTTSDRQGNDVGTQYRSVIWYHNDEQRGQALVAKAHAQAKWDKPIVTQIVPAKPFYVAEKQHQDYLQRNPGGYTCHWIRE